MNLNIYTVKDKQAENYAQPWTAPNHVVAIRTLATEVNRHDTANMLNQYPDQFELRLSGTFDTDTGVIQPENQLIAKCETLIRGEK